MTSNEHMKDHERALRLSSLKMAITSQALEGIEPTIDESTKKWLSGEISSEEFDQETDRKLLEGIAKIKSTPQS